MDAVRIIVLLVALLATGLMAGVFFAWSTSVMPGIRRLDDRPFVAAFQHMDRAIVNPLFVTVLIGAPVAIAAAALLHLGEAAPLAWTSAAFVLYMAVIVITGRVHIPRNNALQAEGDPEKIDTTAARERFDEDRWKRWNTVRGLVNLAAFACLGIALAIT